MEFKELNKKLVRVEKKYETIKIIYRTVFMFLFLLNMT
jgi:hypothetical protein